MRALYRDALRAAYVQGPPPSRGGDLELEGGDLEQEGGDLKLGGRHLELEGRVNACHIEYSAGHQESRNAFFPLNVHFLIHTSCY